MSRLPGVDDAALKRIGAWRNDMALFARDNFGVEPDAWQLKAFKALEAKSIARVALKACTGPGKTMVLAVTGWHRLACFGTRDSHPKGAALSITQENLRTGLWSEMSQLQMRSPFLQRFFTWTKEKIFAKESPSTWFLAARSFSRDADEQAIGRALSGLHGPCPFVLLDEVGDMPVPVGRVAEQIFTGAPKHALVLAAGNPTSTKGLLYDLSVGSRGRWEVITITADPDDPDRTPRVSVETARDAIETYGRDNPWVMATFLGQFPSAGFNNLLSADEVEASMKRNPRLEEYDFSQKRVGADVALYGDDATVLAPRQGLVAFGMEVLRNAKPSEIAARLARGQAKWGQELNFVDGTGGYGSGVIDSGQQAGMHMVDVQFAGKAQDPRFFNARSEMWFRMAEWVKKGGALPEDPGLLQELVTPTYYMQGGKFRLEEKAQIKKRLGRSPDKADALAMTFYYPDQPARTYAGITLPGGGQDSGDGWKPWGAQ